MIVSRINTIYIKRGDRVTFDAENRLIRTTVCVYRKAAMIYEKIDTFLVIARNKTSQTTITKKERPIKI